MTRRLLIVLIVALATGCSRQHRLEWPGLWASGESPLFSPGAALYTRIGFVEGDMSAPSFSVRLPDGTLLSPDQFTIEELDARGAEDRYATSPYHGRGAQPRGFARQLEHETGSIFAHFDEDGRLTAISVYLHLCRRGSWSEVLFGTSTVSCGDTLAMQEGRGGTPKNGIAVGDLYGMKMVPLPATRAELVEVFGEPTRESSHIPTMG